MSSLVQFQGHLLNSRLQLDVVDSVVAENRIFFPSKLFNEYLTYIQSCYNNLCLNLTRLNISGLRIVGTRFQFNYFCVSFPVPSLGNAPMK